MNRFRLLFACALATGVLVLANRRDPETTTKASRESAPPVAAAPAPPAPDQPVAANQPVATRTRATVDAAPPPARTESVPVASTTVGPASPTDAAPVPAGMIVAIDPETGQLVPATAEQIRALFPQGLDPTTGLSGVEIIQRPDGTIGFRVGSQLQEYSFAQIGPDGKILYGCVPGHGKPPTVGELPVLSPKYEER
jgi:hypothetical protein